MYIRTATLETCSTATGIVVVIDVWRSFTTAPFAFAAGARDVVPVGSVEEALALRGRFPGALLMGMGESCCLSLDRFDFAMLVQRQEGLLVMEAVF